ncbi:MAG: carboxylesterase/lipase family protein [Lachnospiraceae bacterium]|nr:carboxylesterase/lipase family protein [Lachnospiraceae bacterium]
MYIRKLTSLVSPKIGQAEVQTKAGILRGVLSDGTYVFRGVEYAHARRFHLPEPPKPWEGVKEAIVYGNACPEIFTCIPHDQYTVPHYFTVQSEDCQYLNVWTRHLDPEAKKPVMVWFHGGGMMTGSGVEHYAYDGEELSKYADVVVVTLNHRLNVLGFLDLSAYGEEYRFSGNAGTADLVAALRWVHDNIEAFGGDPERVMIFGQSGGGGKVASMLQCPYADGLYSRACLQSGGMRKGPDLLPEQSRKVAAYVLEELGISPENVSEIETVWYDELAAAADKALKKTAEETGSRAFFGPVADGDFYMGHPFNAGFRKESAHIPLLVGNVFGEFCNNFAFPKGEGSKNSWSREYTEAQYREYFGGKADAVRETFAETYPEKNPADALFMDGNMRRGVLDFAALRCRQSDAPVYSFLFNLESPFNGGTTAWHNAEIPYVFHNAEYLEPSFIPGVTEILQDIMAGAWANFVASGDPNGGNVPLWPKFSLSGQETMVFDKNTEVKAGHDKKLLSVLPVIPFNMQTLMGTKK